VCAPAVLAGFSKISRTFFLGLKLRDNRTTTAANQRRDAPIPRNSVHQKTAKSHYYDLRFERSLDKALEAVRLALKSAKCVKLSDEAHAYGDKFSAAEVAVRLATSSSLAFAELLGLDAAKASQIRDAKGDGKLSLVCDFCGTTTYLKKREREVEGPTVVVEQKKDTKGSFFGATTKETSTTSVTTKITEHLWTRTASLRLVARKGSSEVVLLDHTLTTTDATRTKGNRGGAARQTVTFTDADWLVSLDPSSFSIDRADDNGGRAGA